jgi:hypothetical protein
MMPARRNLLAISDMLEFCIQAPQKEGDDALVLHFFFAPDGALAQMEGYSPTTHEFVRANLRSELIRSASRISEDPAASLGPGTRRWETEIFLPAEALMREAPFQAGETVCWVLARNYGTGLEQTFIPVSKGFFDPSGMVRARLVEKGPVVRLTSVLPLLSGTGSVALAIGQAGGLPSRARVTCSLTGSDGPASAVAVTLPADGFVPVAWPLVTVTQGVFELEVKDAAEARLFYFRAPYARTPLAMHAAGAGASPVMDRVVYVSGEGTFLTRRRPSGVQESTLLSYRRGAWTHPRLSPVADSVLLTSTQGGTNGIWRLDELGRTQRRLTDGRDACWLPDGTGMVYERGGRLFLMDFGAPGGGKEREVTPEGFTGCRYPAVSCAEPRRLAFVAEGRDLVVCSLDGREVRKLAAGDLCGPCAWSPDGVRLAFQDGPNLWMADVASGEKSLLVGGVGIKSGPSWSADGRSVAAGFSQAEGGAMQWRAFPVGARKVSEGTLVLDNVLSSVDGVWQCAAVTNLPAESPASHPGTRIVLGQTSAGDVLLTARESAPLQGLERRITGWRVPAGNRARKLVVTGPLAHLVVVDRLGRDSLVRPREAEVSLGFAPLLVLPVSDAGGALVVANPAGSATLVARWKDECWTLELGESQGPVGLGFADGEGFRVWQEAAGASPGSNAPVPGVWRYVGGEGGQPVALEGVPGTDTNEARACYFFARAQQSPPAGTCVSDVVADLFGLTGSEREAVVQDRACLGFRVAGAWTAYPLAGLCLDSLAQAARPDQFPFMPGDLAGWAADAEAILAAMDQRLDEYAATARDLEVAELAGLLAPRNGFVAPASLQEERKRLVVDGKPHAKGYLDAARKAVAERESLLSRCRAQAQARRVSLLQDLLNGSNAGARADALRQWQALGRLLANRHLAEGLWLGEPVRLPSQAPWWKGNMWAY